MRKRDRDWMEYEKACAKAEDTYREANEPIYQAYIKAIEKSERKLRNGLFKGEFLPRRPMSGLNCPVMAIKCQNESWCPCQTFLDFQKSRTEVPNV